MESYKQALLVAETKRVSSNVARDSQSRRTYVCSFTVVVLGRPHDRCPRRRFPTAEIPRRQAKR